MEPSINDPVRIRNVERGDLPRMYEMQLDPESNRLAGTIPRSVEAFEAHWANVLRDPHVSAKAILMGEVLVGTVSCFTHEGQAHVGYWVSREHWGKGIASRALELLLHEVATRPLYASAATNNTASLRVLQKCGFVVEQVQLSPATERFSEREVALLVLKQRGPADGMAPRKPSDDPAVP
jgi:RimJ/RimL family protein N-acetyltransferase